MPFCSHWSQSFIYLRGTLDNLKQLQINEIINVLHLMNESCHISENCFQINTKSSRKIHQTFYFILFLILLYQFESRLTFHAHAGFFFLDWRKEKMNKIICSAALKLFQYHRKQVEVNFTLLISAYLLCYPRVIIFLSWIISGYCLCLRKGVNVKRRPRGERSREEEDVIGVSICRGWHRTRREHTFH